MVLLLSFTITLVSCSGSTGKSSSETIDNNTKKQSFFELMGYDRLTNEETEAFIKRDDVIIIDVRKENQYKEKHLPGAINIYYDRFMNGRIEELPDLDQEILVYCDYGGLSGIVADELVAQGYTNVHDFNGLDYWDGEIVSD